MVRGLALAVFAAVTLSVALVSLSCGDDNESPSPTQSMTATTEATAQETQPAPTDAASPTAGIEGPEAFATRAAHAETATTPVTLEAPVTPEASSGGPAAGTCAAPPSDIATVSLPPDLPSPRCSEVIASNRVRLVNLRSQSIHVEFGPFDVDIASGEAVLFDEPVSSYLASGAHVIMVNGNGFGEILVQ